MDQVFHMDQDFGTSHATTVPTGAAATQPFLDDRSIALERMARWTTAGLTAIGTTIFAYVQANSTVD